MNEGVHKLVKVVVIALALFGAYTLLAPDQAGYNGGSVEGDTVRVGFIAPLTGDAAAYGEPAQQVVALAVEQINEQGGINGKSLEVIYEDGKCNGKDAANAMQKLVTVDKVQAVVGGFCSSESLAAAPIANEHNVLLFSPGSSSPDLSEKGGLYFFRNYPSDASQGKVLAEASYNKKGWKHVAIIQEQLDYPLGVRNAFESVFTDLGGTVTVETFAPETTDFRTVLTKLKSSGADALLVSVQTPAVAETILKQLKDVSWSPALIGADIIPGSDLPSTQPELVEGMIVAQFGIDASNEKYQAFETAFTEKYQVEALPFGSYAQTEYDAVLLLAEALKAVGNDGKALQQWFTELTGYEGTSGLNSFDENGDRRAGHVLQVIEGGEVKPLE